MVFTAEQSARNAEADTKNDPGMCQQQTRIWCGIGGGYPDASTAWKHTNDRHPGDRTNIPRGAAVYWTGGSKGFGHAALSLGNGKIRSTDAAGRGVVGTRTLEWFDQNWPSLRYAGWSWDINEVTIPHSDKDDDDMPLNAEDLNKIRKIVSEEVEKRVGDVIPWPTKEDKNNKVTARTALSRLKPMNEKLSNLVEDSGK